MALGDHEYLGSARPAAGNYWVIFKGWSGRIFALPFADMAAYERYMGENPSETVFEGGATLGEIGKIMEIREPPPPSFIPENQPGYIPRDSSARSYSRRFSGW